MIQYVTHYQISLKILFPLNNACRKACVIFVVNPNGFDIEVLFLIAGLEGAAFQSRFPFDRLSTAEAMAFYDIAQAPIQTQKMYLHLRNRTVRKDLITCCSYRSWQLST